MKKITPFPGFQFSYLLKQSLLACPPPIVRLSKDRYKNTARDQDTAEMFLFLLYGQVQLKYSFKIFHG